MEEEGTKNATGREKGKAACYRTRGLKCVCTKKKRKKKRRVLFVMSKVAYKIGVGWGEIDFYRRIT